jgi:hypothetical protein
MHKPTNHKPGQTGNPRPYALTLILILISTALPVYAAPSMPSSPTSQLSNYSTDQLPTTQNLWIDMLIGPPLVPFFNENARPDDVARVDHYSQIAQLAGVNGGQKMVVFKSAADAEQLLPELASQLDAIGYNLEHGPGTPPDEQADPAGSIQRMRALADAHDLVLALGPDHNFALSHGVALAPYVDIFVLQIQRQQTNPPVVEEFVVPLVPQLRAANPDLQVTVQVRTEGDTDAIVELIESLLPYIDGVSILTSPDTVEIAKELVNKLRSADTPFTPSNLLYLPMHTRP